MTVKFNKSAYIRAVRPISLADMPEWTFVFYLDVVSADTTSDFQMIGSTGELVSGSLNVAYCGPGHSNRNSVAFTVGSSTTPYSTPADTFPVGWKGIVALQRTAGAGISIHWCPLLTSAPVDGAAVSSTADLVNSTQANSLNKRTVMLGTRADGLRGLAQTLARAGILQGKLTAHEIARLAYGEPLQDMGKAPLYYVRMDDASDTTDRGSEASATTISGTLADGPAPGWGYTGPAAPSAPVFTTAPAIIGSPAVGAVTSYTSGTVAASPAAIITRQWTIDGVDVAGATGATFTPPTDSAGKGLRVRETATNGSGSASSTSAQATIAAEASSGVFTVAEMAHKVIQRLPVITGTSAPAPFTGTYDTLPAAVEVRLYAGDAVTVAKDWTPLTDATFSGQTWAGKIEAPTGGPYKHQVRFKNAAGAVIGQSAIASINWYVGALFAVGGSSSGEGWFTTGTFTARSDVFKYRNSAWSVMTGTSNGPACLFANAMAIKLGVPIGLIAYASSGTTLEDWARDGGSSAWTAFSNAVNGRGGKLEGVLFTAGSNDANENGVVSQASHLAKMRKMVAKIRTLTGQPDLKFAWTGFNARLTANPTQSDWVREAEKQIADDPGVCHVSAVDLEVGGDNTHLTGNGYRDTMLRVNYQWEVVNGVGNIRSPSVSKFEYAGNRVRVTVRHTSGSAIVVPAAASGLVISDGNGARTITGYETVSGAQFDAIVDQPLAGTVTVTHMAGAWPARTAPIMDNSAVPLPLAVETLLPTVAGNFSNPAPEPTPDTTAPTMVGSISVANITTSGARLAWQSATDAVGVEGYEYSLNGGTSYANAGNVLSVSLTGLSPASAIAARVRAYDAAGNRSAPLSASFTTLAEQPPVQNQVDGSKIAVGRRVVFPGGTRVVMFGEMSSAPMANAPYLREGRWTVDKHPLDQRYYVADVTADLRERNTTAKSVEPVAAGVTVLEQPVVQGNLIPVKLGGFNAAPDASNFFTFRVTCANGERFDRTLWFRQQEGRWTLQKDPDDESFFVGDIGHDLADSGTTATAVTALPVGVSVLSPAVLQGTLVVVKLGGMDGSPDPVNYCDLRVDCANGERFYRTIHFNRVDN